MATDASDQLPPAGGPPRDLRCRVHATAENIAVMRHQLAAWAARAGLATEAREDFLLAVYEAMANVAEHAYAGRSLGTLDLEVSCAPPELIVVVRDRGRWREPPADPGTRGRGLKLMRGLAAADVVSGRRGTTVRMIFPAPVSTRLADLSPGPGAEA